jgi:hypothetical protein
MAIVVACASCEHEFKVKDAFAGRKVRCPECGKAVAAPDGTVAEETEPKPRRSARRDNDRKGSSERHVHREEPLNLNNWGDKLAQFDVKRFTVAGWLLFAVSVAAGLGAYAIVEMNYEWIMGIPPNQGYYRKWNLLYVLAVLISGFGCFFIGFGAFYLLGVKVIRRKPDADNNHDGLRKPGGNY